MEAPFPKKVLAMHRGLLTSVFVSYNMKSVGTGNFHRLIITLENN